MRIGILGGLLLVLGACQALQRPDMPATLQAEAGAYVAEATAIAQTVQAQQERLAATVDAAGTRVAETNSINQQLLATARVLVPPTPGRTVGSAPEVAGSPMPEMMSADGAGTPAFINTGVTGSIRESDGCANGLQTQFTADADRIYVTTRATSIRAGTVMSVEWRYEGQVVYSDTWTVNQDATDFCLWYFITPEDVPFQAGNWSVELAADGSKIEPAVSFSITAG
ncbi:MAG: hypothetical protein HZC41_01190 [Chloroflexi bacterium]|nr:hypothetical protein [Chloroflexota bacterium]